MSSYSGIYKRALKRLAANVIAKWPELKDKLERLMAEGKWESVKAILDCYAED